MKQTVIPFYADQEISEQAADVLRAILKQEYAPGQVLLNPINTVYGRINQKVLVFGKLPMEADPANDYVHTYSIAQLMTKANAASAVTAAIQQFLDPKPVPTFKPKAVPASYVYETLDLSAPIAVDIETSGALGIDDTPEEVGLLSVAFYQPGHPPLVVTSQTYGMTQPTSGRRFYAEIAKLLPLVEQPIWHNGKFDIRVIQAQTGVKMPNYFDTMLAHHGLNQAAGDHKLKHLARTYLGAPEWERDLSKYTVGGAHYENIPHDMLVEYNGWDVYWTYALYEYLKPLVEGDEQVAKAFMLEMAAGDFLLEVEQNGFAFDVPRALELEQEMQAEVSGLLTKLQNMVGTTPPYNPGSWQQTKRFLESVGLALPNTSEASLEDAKKALDPADPLDAAVIVFIDTLLEFRGVKKALATYVQGGLKAQRNGRVHTTFLIHGTSTGRLSSSGPNVQNIPRDKKYRSLYIGE